MSFAVVWSYRASSQYLKSLRHIEGEDVRAAVAVQERVEKSLQLLEKFPNLGTIAAVPGVRTYPVPKTGHSFDYRLVRNQIRIQRWYRQRQMPTDL